MEPETGIGSQDSPQQELVFSTPGKPLPSPDKMPNLTERGAAVITPVGTFQMKGLEIDFYRLSEALSTISADIGWFSSWETGANYLIATLQLNLKRKEAELSQKWQLKKAEGTKLTVDDIKHNIALDVNVQKLEDSLAEAKYHLEIFQGLRRAHETKARLLPSAINLRRTELDADIHSHRLKSMGATRDPGTGVVLPS